VDNGPPRRKRTARPAVSADSNFPMRNAFPRTRCGGGLSRPRRSRGRTMYEAEDEGEASSDTWYQGPPKRLCRRGRGGGPSTGKGRKRASKDRVKTVHAS
jgi:hypothetical protein